MLQHAEREEESHDHHQRRIETADGDMIFFTRFGRSSVLGHRYTKTPLQVLRTASQFVGMAREDFASLLERADSREDVAEQVVSAIGHAIIDIIGQRLLQFHDRHSIFAGMFHDTLMIVFCRKDKAMLSHKAVQDKKKTGKKSIIRTELLLELLWRAILVFFEVAVERHIG